ncbi:M12 family metallo-peptidase [Runella sp. MFBS21]|uniref:M12 family metallo-peptidase n=1 Tax=Runella sp. MFBS21 TaxID=3034018 RepID=UPI0023FA385E|nr:M12 family metallo-peptidase [Runella sp. MFBS21]MDF7816397.1 M12 family metallo-peptidase [Runella sp. MFBS21]
MKKLLCFLIACLCASVYAQVPQEKPLACGTTEVPDHIRKLMLSLKGASTPTARTANEPLREMKVWVVVDSTIYGFYKADTNAIKAHIYFIYQQTNIIFNKQLGIHLNVVSIEILKKKNRYTFATRGVSNDFGQLYNFSEDYSKRRDVVRDLTVMWTRYTGEPYGGVAFLGGAYQHDTGDQLSPYLIAHETGHNLGSPHTHDCSWRGGPIDACNDIEGGNCYTGTKTSNTGTVMSYCSKYGIEGHNVFHPLCVELIKKVAKDSYGLIPMQSAPFAAPALLYPTNGSESTTNHYFSWRTTTQTTHYQVQISDKADFANVLLDTTTHAPSFWVGKKLAFNTPHYWRVRARNESGAGAWSASFTFKTASSISLTKPVVYEVYNLKTHEDQIIAFSSIADAVEYEVSFHRVGSNESLTAANTYKTIKTTKTTLRIGDILSRPADLGSYRWRVRALNGTTVGEWSDDNDRSVYFYNKLNLNITANPTYSVPLEFPMSLNVDFNRLDNYRRITVDVAKDADFKNIAFTKQLVNDDSNQPENFYVGVLPISGLESDTKYFYRVKAVSRIDSSTQSSEFKTGLEQRWKLWNSTTNSVLPANAYLRGVYVDNANSQWVYGIDGIYEIKSDGSVNAFNQATSNKMLPNSINDLTKDSRGRVWAATRDGLAYFENNQWTTLRNRAPFGRNVGGYIWYNSFNRVASAPNNVVYANASDVSKILRYDGNEWSDITPPSTLYGSYPAIFNTDKNGNLYILSPEKNNRIGVYENGTWSEITIPNFTNNPNTYYRLFDNTGRIWLATWIPSQSNYDIAVFTSRADIKFLTNQISYVESSTGVTKTGFLTSFMNTILVGKKYTYFMGYNGFLEYDGARYVYYNYPTISAYTMSAVYTPQNFSIDSEDRLYYVEAGNTIYRFERNNFNGFLQKQVGTGCNLTFRVGLATPPTNSMAMKFYLSDANGANFKETPATYKDGYITFSIPNDGAGKGYRVKYTFADIFESKESEPFEISAPFTKLAITGNNTFCFGNATTLKAEVTGGKSPYTYAWSKGGSAETYTASAEGAYTVTVKDASNCIQTSGEVILTTTGAKEAKITPVGNLEVYEPNTVVLNANTGDNFTYQWQKDGTDLAGATTATYEAKTSGSYVVKVQKDGCSLASASVGVKIDKLLSVPNSDIPTSLVLTNYPNPFATSTTFKLGLPRQSKVKMNLLSTKGETLNTIKEGILEAGWYLIKLDDTSLPAGVYFCQIMTEEGTKTLKLMVAK